MSECEVCGEREADRLLGIDKELPSQDAGNALTLTKNQVLAACGECADDLVTKGVAREIHGSTGEANDIWYSDRYEITDGETSLSIDEQVPVEEIS